MRYPDDFRQRFWAKVAMCIHGEECPDCCWPWQGAFMGNYGVIWAPPALRAEGVRYIKVHRAAWEMQYGPIPAGMWILHDCPQGDNPGCVNYNGHLWKGDALANNQDMIRKGRQRYPHGFQRSNTKLSEQDVAMIATLRGQLSQAAIAQRFGISAAMVGNIQRGERRHRVPRQLFPGERQAEQVAKLTREKVYEIRRLKGQMPERIAAERSGVTRAHIGRIWRRECWGWLPEESGVEEALDQPGEGV